MQQNRNGEKLSSEGNRYMALEIAESSKLKQPLANKQRVILAIISLVVGFIIFSIAYAGMRYKIGISVLNQPVLSWMVAHRHSSVIALAKAVTTVANPTVFASIVGVFIVIWAIVKKEIWRPALLAGSMAAIAIMSLALKDITMNPRPPQINMIRPFETDFSFPSGHTIGVATFLLVFGYLIYSRHYGALRFWGWMTLTVAGTVLIAFSRLYLGYHWLTDVVASAGLSLIVLAAIIAIDTIFIHRFEK
jgi:undecaprenyl-diphosphatase